MRALEELALVLWAVFCHRVVIDVRAVVGWIRSVIFSNWLNDGVFAAVTAGEGETAKCGE